jgi:hypothetical protein
MSLKAGVYVIHSTSSDSVIQVGTAGSDTKALVVDKYTHNLKKQQVARAFPDSHRNPVAR